MKMFLLGAAAVVLMSGCATTLDPGADKVRIVTAQQKERCESLGVLSVEQRTGPNKPGSAMNKAMNEVAKRGGNGLFVVATSTDWAEGASVTGEAMRCGS